MVSFVVDTWLAFFLKTHSVCTLTTFHDSVHEKHEYILYIYLYIFGSLPFRVLYVYVYVHI